MAKSPIFLERRSYRKRRMIDAIRLLPLLGLLLWMLPLIWPVPVPVPAAEEGSDVISTSVALRYLFGVWIAMVLFGWLLWRRTAASVADMTSAQTDMHD